MKQVEEIMTQYGPVSEIWFDMGSLTGEQSKELYNLVTRLQPQCMISGRLGNDRGDFSVMGDNQIPDYKIGTPWQTAASFFKETWSYRSWQERGSLDAKVDEKLLGMINVISRGGNYLLNIGPRGDGSVVEFERDALLKMGGWVNRYAEAIYSTTANPFDHAPAWGDITRKGNTLYLFVEHMPANRTIELNGVLGNASRAILLADSRALQVAVAAYQACYFLGMPECDVHLTHAVVYLSMAPKSNALYTACESCKKDVRTLRAEPVPMQIRNAPTGLMKELGYGKGYEYAHDTEEKLTHMQCMPDSLKDHTYYYPTEEGEEKETARRLREIKDFRRE